MVRNPHIIQRRDDLKSKIAAMPPTSTKIAVFITLTAICLACASSVQKTPGKDVPRDSPSSLEWLTQADYMPTYDVVPQQPRLPDMFAREREINTKTTIEFYIDELGKVNPVLTKIKKTSGYDALDRIALQWAKQVTFHPGIHQGKPVKVVLSREIQWLVR